MEVHLMYENRDFRQENPLYPWEEELISDLELEKILKTMARGDERILEAAKLGLLHPLEDREEILRRQEILRDCQENPDRVRELYDLLQELTARKQSESWWMFSGNASNRFYGTVQRLQLYVPYLGKLRKLAERWKNYFHSEGFRRLFREMGEQLDDGFLKEAVALLEELEFKDGTLMELTLDGQNRPAGYHLVRKNPKDILLRWTFTPGYVLAPRDDAGARDLSSRVDRACAESLSVLEEAAESIESWLLSLQTELAFYLGQLNLLEEMDQKGIPHCFPALTEGTRSFRELRDLSLSLRVETAVGNDLNQEGKRLFVITGANQGGKTTFLRSIGQMQLFAQAGLTVAAASCSCPICAGVFTHFKREEKENRGKLDEELERLNRMVPAIKPGSLILLNESFSSTNEREGSEICAQITRAFYDHGVEQFHVSHLYTFTKGLWDEKLEGACFLRAGRNPEGSRSFRMTPGQPERTAYGEDLYRKLMNPAE